MLFRLLLLLTVFHSSIFASLTLKDGDKDVTDFSLNYYIDTTNSHDIETIRTINFNQSIHSHFTLGYNKNTIWFKLDIRNESQKEHYILNFSEPFWSHFTLYKKENNQWKAFQNGLFTPLSQREIPSSNPAFTLTIPKGSSNTYYIKADTINGQLGAFSLLSSDRYYQTQRFTTTKFYQFYTLFLIIIIILNLFLLIQMKERINLYYIAYVFSYILFISMFSASYLSFNLPAWPEGLHVIGAIVLVFMALFSSEFLEVKSHFPEKRKFFTFSISVFLILALLISLHVPYITLVFNLFAFSFMLFLLFLALKTLKREHDNSLFYLISLIIYMPTMALMALTFDGIIINNIFTRYSFLLGAMLELILFSLILVRKFHLAQYDTIRLQAELLLQNKKHQKHLEEELNKQHKLLQTRNAMILEQSRHAQMGEMISMIAHQWRQPLSSISAVAGTMHLQIALDDYDQEYHSKSLEKINQYTQDLSKTINDFRDLHKNTGIRSISSLDKLVFSSLNIIQPTLNAKKITVKVIYENNNDFPCYAQELRQVIFNLLKNSQEAYENRASKDGEITIRTYSKEDKYCIDISDNAGGIDPKILSKIFDPYFTTKDLMNGSGLGLYMSKKTIEEQCKGKVVVTNRSNGVTFTLQLSPR